MWGLATQNLDIWAHISDPSSYKVIHHTFYIGKRIPALSKIILSLKLKSDWGNLLILCPCGVWQPKTWISGHTSRTLVHIRLFTIHFIYENVSQHFHK